ncbi:hypothetical protein B5E64_16995 [Drancourtella sp. An12]|nr:hypothetical protein B5E64_16995 [Drancourtella sp. An12]
MENNRRKQGGSTAEEAFFMEATVETKTVLRLQSKYCPIKPSVATKMSPIKRTRVKSFLYVF